MQANEAQWSILKVITRNTDQPNSFRSRWQFAALVCLLALLCPFRAIAQNFAYVNNQNGASNSISIFSVDTGGVATSLGSVNTGGVGAPVACSGIDRITANLAGNLLFVSNSGDQTISAFRINPTTGALTAVPGSPFASGLTLDSCAGISLATTPDGHFLMASSNGQVKTFSIALNGSLSLSSTASLLPAPMVGMKISGDGRLLAVSHQASVSLFTINGADGSLTAVAGSPFPKSGTGLVGGVEFNCDGTLLYAAEGGAASSITDAWSVAPSGALTPLLGSPFTAAGSDSNIVFLTPDNTILYQSNQGSNDLNSFTVNPDGTLTSIGLANIAVGHKPVGLASDTSGLFLYAADDAFGLGVFNIIPGVTPTLVGDTAILSPGQVQGVAAYPPRSCAHTDFSITQTATPNPVTAGNQITYNITVTNNGPAAASVAINDLLPRNFVTFVSCTPGPGAVCDKGAGLNRTITFASLASGQSGTVTILASSVATLLNGDTITNTSGVSNSSAVDPNPANNSATTNVTVSAPLSATNFIVANSTGTYFGVTTLTTTLKRTLNGAAIAGRTITFSINGIDVGTAVTNASGVATLPNVSLVVAGNVLTAGTYNGGLGVRFDGDSQFAASSGTSTLTVNKATLTVTTQPATRVYGDPNPAFTYIISGFLNNETTAVVTGTANCTSSAGLNTPAGTQTITCSIGSLAAANYIFTFVNGTLTITRAPLVLTGNSVTRLYGDPNPAITGTVVGLKAGDQANATFSTAAGTSSPVGTYPITGVLVPVGGFNANNYTVTSSGNVTVNQAPLTTAANSVSRLYGDPNPAFTGTITGLKNGDVITGTFSAAAGITSSVGTYPITATLSDPGNKLGNYTIVASGTLTITPAPLTVLATDASRIYGDPNPPFTGTLTGLRNGDNVTATFTSAAVAGSPVGAYPIVATLVDPAGKAGNYSVAPSSGTLTITPAPLAVSANNASRLYGDANPAFTGAITGIKNADNIRATFSTLADAASPIGSFAIIPSLVDPASKLGNYSVLSTNGSLAINAAPLTVSAANVARLYGDANPALTGTITGIKNADNITATFASAALVTSPVGTFAIVPALVDPGNKAGNYIVTSNNGILTVSPALLTVSAANATRLYGDANPAFIGTITGIKNADNITATFATAATPASNVGAFSIVPALVDPGSKLGNYTVTSNNGTLTIGAAALAVSAADATRLYGDPNPVFTGTLTGLKNGDSITATFASAATSASGVGTFSIVPSLVDPASKLGNYAMTSTNGLLTITPASLSVTAGNASRPYGDPNPAFTGTITGLKNGDNITASVSGANAASAVGTYPLIPTLVDPAGKLPNYSVTVTNGTLTVTPAALNVTAGNSTRAYGDANPAFTGTITGIKNADNITATYASAALVTSSVGSFAIVPTLVDPGAKLSNYTITSSNGTLTITAAALTVTGTNANRLYGDANPAFTGTIAGIKNNDNITATLASTAAAGSPVGNFAIVPTLSDPTAKLGNYALTSVNGTLTIAPAPLTVTGTDATRVYGDANPAFTGTITGLKNNDNISATFASPATAASSVSTFAIVPTLVDPTAKAGNYIVTANNGILTVTPAALSVTAGNATRIYGDPNPSFTGTITGLKNGDNITASVSGTGADPASPVGTYVLVPALIDPTGKLGNYTVTSSNGQLTITPAALSVSAAGAARIYGDSNPAFTGTITGLKNNDNITAAFASAATAASNVGTFPIIPSLLDPTAKLTNYTVVSSNGTLTVGPAPLTVTGANLSRIYGDANPAFTGTIAGIKNADNITATFASPAVAGSPVGTFALVPTLVDPAGKLPNYTVVSNNGALTITPAALSVTGANATRAYGDPNPSFTGTITGLKNGDNITATFASAATTATAVGTASIVPTLVDPGTRLGNYSVASNNGVLTITQAPLTVTAGDATRQYGDPNPAFTGTITGLKNGDTITATISGAGADPTSPVGSYTLIPALNDPNGKLGNYSVTLNNGALTITAAPLNVTAANASRLYGDPNPAFTGTILGIRNADSITATYASAALASSPAGTASIIPTLVDPAGKLGNYIVTANNGVLTIAPAPLSVAGAALSRLYGDPNPVLAGTITGIKNGDNITPSYSTAAIVTSAVGAFPIIPALSDPTAKLGNYTVTSLNGTLTIAPAPLTVTGENAARFYGDSNPAFTGTLTGVKNSDNITATFGSTAIATSAVGTYPITGTLSDPTSKLGNYNVTSISGVFSINPVALIVTANNATRIYGDPNPAFSGTITGLRNADNITVSFTSVGPGSPVGNFAIVPVLADPTVKLGNYVVNSTNGTLTINVAPLSVTAANAARPYGSSNPLFTGTIIGIKNADSISATFSTVAVPESLLGTYPIVPALVDPGARLGNYSVTSVNGMLTVGQATPVLTVTAQPGQPTSVLRVVVQNAGAILPTGTVQFFDGNVALGSAVAIASPSGTAPEASIQPSLAAGNHAITVTYSGDAVYKTVTTNAINVTVGPAPAFAFTGTGGNTSATVTAGQNAVFNVSLNPQGFTGAIGFTCAGAPAGTTCTVNPTSTTVTAASANVPVTVTVAGTQNAGLVPAGLKSPWLAFAGVFAGLLFTARRKRKQLVLLIAAAGLLAGITACGGGVNNGGGGPVRQPTNAVLTLTGASGSQTATITLNLTINH